MKYWYVHVHMCIHSGLGGDVHLQGPPEWDTINRRSHYQSQFDNTAYVLWCSSTACTVSST